MKYICRNCNSSTSFTHLERCPKCMNKLDQIVNDPAICKDCGAPRFCDCDPGEKDTVRLVIEINGEEDDINRADQVFKDMIESLCEYDVSYISHKGPHVAYVCPLCGSDT